MTDPRPANGVRHERSDVPNRRFATSAVVLVFALAIAITALALEGSWLSWTAWKSTGQSISRTHMIDSKNARQKSYSPGRICRPTLRKIKAMTAPR